MNAPWRHLLNNFHAFWALRTGQELKKGEILKARKSDFLDVVADAGLCLRTALKTVVEKMGVIDDSYLPQKDLIALIGASYLMHVARWQPRAVAYLWAVCVIEDSDSSTNDKTRHRFRQFGELIGGKLARDFDYQRIGKEILLV